MMSRHAFGPFTVVRDDQHLHLSRVNARTSSTRHEIMHDLQPDELQALAVALDHMLIHHHTREPRGHQILRLATTLHTQVLDLFPSPHEPSAVVDVSLNVSYFHDVLRDLGDSLPTRRPYVRYGGVELSILRRPR